MRVTLPPAAGRPDVDIRHWLLYNKVVGLNVSLMPLADPAVAASSFSQFDNMNTI